MKRMMVVVISLVVLGWLVAGVGRGELTPEQLKEAQELIRKLGDTNYAVREDATKKLLAMGMGVMEVLKQVQEETEDAEVQARCRLVMMTLIEQAELAPLEPLRVTVDMKDVSLAEVLKELARQSGNREIDAAGLGDRKVTLQVKDVPYWQAVDKLCENAGLMCGPKQDAARLDITLMEKPEGAQDIGALAGPAMIKISSVRRTINRQATLRGKPMRMDNYSLMIDFMVCMEDRLPLLGATLDLNSLRAANGMEQTNAQGAVARAAFRMMRGRSGSYWPTSVGFQEALGGMEGTATMEGTLELTYGLQSKELRVEKIFTEKTGEAVGDGRKLTMKEVRRDGRSVTVGFSLITQEEGQELLMSGGTGCYGMFLVNPYGKRHGNGRLTSLRRTAGAETVMEVTMTFTEIPELEGDWTLVYAYPGKLVKRSYPFTMFEVPLP